MSSANITSSFCNHFSIISRLQKYVVIILELNWNQRFSCRNTKIEHLSLYAHVVHKTAKTGHFTLREEQERLRNVLKWKMPVQSVQNHCFHCQNLWGSGCRRRHCLLKLPVGKYFKRSFTIGYYVAVGSSLTLQMQKPVTCCFSGGDWLPRNKLNTIRQQLKERNRGKNI